MAGPTPGGCRLPMLPSCRVLLPMPIDELAGEHPQKRSDACIVPYTIETLQPVTRYGKSTEFEGLLQVMMRTYEHLSGGHGGVEECEFEM